MFRNKKNETFWILEDNFEMPRKLEAYVDSSYSSPHSKVKAAKHQHHSSGFVFAILPGQKNVGFTRKDYPLDQLLTSNNAELIGINNFLAYIAEKEPQPESVTIMCDNISLMYMLSNLRDMSREFGVIINDSYLKSIHQEDLKIFLKLLMKFPNIEFNHVKGHSGVKDNMVADGMAHFGKRVNAGESFDSDLIFEFFGQILVNWKNGSVPPNYDWSFTVAVSQEKYEIHPGEFRRGYALYNPLLDTFESGIFETRGTEGPIHALAAVHGLKKLNQYVPKDKNISFEFSNLLGERVFLSYIHRYLVDKKVATPFVANVFHEHRGLMTHRDEIGVRSIRVSKTEDEQIGYKRATSKADEVLDEFIENYSLYRS